jgi:hypothetical protein
LYEISLSDIKKINSTIHDVNEVDTVISALTEANALIWARSDIFCLA